ncbi:hypothetical protein BN2475_70102 [Paraburkholderia ribeironis]|uniref:Uncharacterized protein n=1 Tax=Paraburkholderia ribeironis TaxID=1247936 RepID=A0A1N7RM11_9BURK|nr:hypothetical protein BN2475_70102 [Paraburkholderia ribeironis]
MPASVQPYSVMFDWAQALGLSTTAIPMHAIDAAASWYFIFIECLQPLWIFLSGTGVAVIAAFMRRLDRRGVRNAVWVAANARGSRSNAGADEP